LSPDPRTLRLARRQLQFELAQARVELLRAAARCAQTRKRLKDLTIGIDSTLRELRQAVSQARTSPAVIGNLRGRYQADLHALERCHGVFTEALREEERARGVLDRLLGQEEEALNRRAAKSGCS
jgi:hypothetical protein